MQWSAKYHWEQHHIQRSLEKSEIVNTSPSDEYKEEFRVESVDQFDVMDSIQEINN